VIAGDDAAADAALSQSQAEDSDGFPNAVLIETTDVLDRRLAVILIDKATAALDLVLPDGLGRLPLVEGATLAVGGKDLPDGSTTVSRDGLDYTLTSVTISDAVGGQTAPVGEAFVVVDVTVTNRTDQGIRLALASLAEIVEDGRYPYAFADITRLLSPDAVDDRVYEPNLPIDLRLAALLPSERGHIEMLVHGPSGAARLPLDNKTIPETLLIAGPVASGVLSAGLVAAGWTETNSERVLTVDVNLALTSDNPLQTIDIPDNLVSLVSDGGERWEPIKDAPLRRPLKAATLFGGGESVLGGALQFVVPLAMVGPFQLRVDGVDPPILLPVPSVDGGTIEDVLVEEPAVPLTLAFERTPITAGIPIAVQYAGMPGNSEDWLAIANAGSSDEQYIEAISLEGQTAGRAVFNSFSEGEYELRAYFNWPDNGYRVEQRIAFSVAPRPEIVPGSLLSLPRNPAEGEQVVVQWRDFPGFDADWIAISKPGDPDGTSGTYVYLDGRPSGRAVFDPLPVGDYEIRAYFNNAKIVQDRIPLAVSARNFVRTIRDDAEIAGFTNVAHIARGSLVEAAGRNGQLIADGDALTYEDGEGYAVLNPERSNRIWFARPYAIERVRLLLADFKPANYAYVLKGTEDGINWVTLADHSREPVPGGWQDIAVPSRPLIGLSLENLAADGDGSFRVVELAAYTAAPVDIADTIPIPPGEMPDWTSAPPQGPVNVALESLGSRIEGDGAANALDGLVSGYAAEATTTTPLTLTLDKPYPLEWIHLVLTEEDQPAFRVEISGDGTTFEALTELEAGRRGTIELAAPANVPVAAIRIVVPEGAERPVTLFEIEALATVGAPVTATGARQPAAKRTAGRNVALAVNGGRIAAVTSERDPIHNSYNLIDGDVRTDWHSADVSSPEDVVIALGGRLPVTIDAVDIFNGGYGSEPAIVELAAGTRTGGWVGLGRFALHSSPVERLSFAPVATEFLRLRVVQSAGERVTLGEIVVREAETPDVEPRIATHWPGFKGGLNIAMLALGGTVVSAAPFDDDPNYGPFRLIDGYGAGTGAWADEGSADVPYVTIGFRNGAEAKIAGLAFVANGGHSNFTADERWTRMLDVWVSATDPDTGYVWLGRYALDQSDATQIVSFPPVNARYVRVLLLDTFGDAGPVLGEIEVLEAPGESITGDDPPNLLDSRYGGHVAVPAGTNRSHLIDSSAATDGWYDDTGARPIDITFGFKDGAPRTFDAVGFNPRTALPPATWARRAKISVSDHPLRDFRFVAEVEIDPDDRLQYFELPQTRARYLKVTLLENGGDPVMSLGEVAVRGVPGDDGLLSIATREDPVDDREVLDDLPEPFEGDLAEAEPNDVRDDATTLPFAQRMTGAVSPLSDVDWFGFDTSDASTGAVNATVEEQPRLNSDLTLFGPDGSRIGTQPLYDLGMPRADFTWLLPQGENALSLSRAPNSIVFIVDRSGSVESVRKDIAAAAVRFAENALPDEEISFVAMDGGETYNEFTSDKTTLLAAAKRTIEGSGGSPVYESLRTAMERLAKREGAKAIVIVTDGEDSGSSKQPLYDLWRDLGKTGVRIYTVGFGSAVTNPLEGLLGSTGGDMLRSFSAATGGRFFRAPTGQAMRDIYARISADLRSESGYRITLAPSPAMGALDVTSVGEAITGVSAPQQVGLILDASGSMKRTLEDGTTRMDAARTTLHGLVDNLPDATEVALVVYGHRLPSKPHDESCKDIELVVPFAPLDRDVMHNTIDDIKARGETPIGRSLVGLLQSFDPAIEHRYAILITDGEESCDPDPADRFYPPKVIEAIRAAGIDITLSIVGFAIGDKATEDFLARLAESTGGAYYGADDQAALDTALKQAFSASYTVTDSLGQIAVQGKVGGGPVTLPEGRWRVTLDSEPAIDLGVVGVTGNETTSVELSREGDRVEVMIRE
jgi:Mg-chelatase subunit ChlD